MAARNLKFGVETDRAHAHTFLLETLNQQMKRQWRYQTFEIMSDKFNLPYILESNPH